MRRSSSLSDCEAINPSRAGHRSWSSPWCSAASSSPRWESSGSICGARWEKRGRPPCTSWRRERALAFPCHPVRGPRAHPPCEHEHRDKASRSDASTRAHLVAITYLGGVFVHGLILFNRAPFWDGRLVETFLRRHDYEGLFHFFSAAGGIGCFIHWTLAHLGGVIAYRVLALCSPIVAATVVYDVNRREQFVFLQRQGEGSCSRS